MRSTFSAHPRTAMALALLATGAGGAARAQAAPAASGVMDRPEIVVPAPGAERVRVENLLGRVQVRAWDQPGRIHIVAEKRGPTPASIERLRVHYTAWQSGEVQIDTRIEAGGREQSLPQSGSRVDLLIEVPPELEVEARTFAGDLSASGLVAGARLETTGGRIGVSNVRGGLVTRQLRGGQTVIDVEGDVQLDGVEGDIDARDLAGGRMDARMVDGNIRADDVRSDWVRLTSTTGSILCRCAVHAGARYELRSYAGDVRLVRLGPAIGIEVRVRSPQPLDTPLRMRVVARERDLVRAVLVEAAGGRRRGLPGGMEAARPILELSSVLGRVSLVPATLAPDVVP